MSPGERFASRAIALLIGKPDFLAIMDDEVANTFFVEIVPLAITAIRQGTTPARVLAALRCALLVVGDPQYRDGLVASSRDAPS